MYSTSSIDDISQSTSNSKRRQRRESFYLPNQPSIEQTNINEVLPSILTGENTNRHKRNRRYSEYVPNYSITNSPSLDDSILCQNTEPANMAQNVTIQNHSAEISQLSFTAFVNSPEFKNKNSDFSEEFLLDKWEKEVIPLISKICSFYEKAQSLESLLLLDKEQSRENAKNFFENCYINIIDYLNEDTQIKEAIPSFISFINLIEDIVKYGEKVHDKILKTENEINDWVNERDRITGCKKNIKSLLNELNQISVMAQGQLYMLMNKCEQTNFFEYNFEGPKVNITKEASDIIEQDHLTVVKFMLSQPGILEDFNKGEPAMSVYKRHLSNFINNKKAIFLPLLDKDNQFIELIIYHNKNATKFNQDINPSIKKLISIKGLLTILNDNYLRSPNGEQESELIKDKDIKAQHISEMIGFKERIYTDLSEFISNMSEPFKTKGQIDNFLDKFINLATPFKNSFNLPISSSISPSKRNYILASKKFIAYGFLKAFSSLSEKLHIKRNPSNLDYMITELNNIKSLILYLDTRAPGILEPIYKCKLDPFLFDNDQKFKIDIISENPDLLQAVIKDPSLLCENECIWDILERYPRFINIYQGVFREKIQYDIYFQSILDLCPNLIKSFISDPYFPKFFASNDNLLEMFTWVLSTNLVLLDKNKFFMPMLIKNKDKLEIILSESIIFSTLLENQNVSLLIYYCGWLLDDITKFLNSIGSNELKSFLNNEQTILFLAKYCRNCEFMKLIIDYPGIGNAIISNQIICEMLNNNSEIIEAINNKRIFRDMLLRNKDKINLILSTPALLNELIANENATLLVSYCGWLIDEPDKLSNNLKKQSLIDLLNNTNLFIPFISTYKDQHNLINLIINHPETAMIIILSKSLIKLLTETNPQLVIDLLNNEQLLSNFINDPFCIFSN